MSEDYVFDFQKEILEYCLSDIDILRRGIMKLREDFIQLESIDPLRYITIASVCMTIYHNNYMSKKTVESWAKISKILVDLGVTRDINKNQRQRVKGKAIKFSIQQNLYSYLQGKTVENLNSDINFDQTST